MGQAWPARDGWRAVLTTRGLPRAAEGAQGRVLDGRLVVVRQSQLDEAIEVLENLGIPLNRGLPVLVDTALQLRLRRGDLVGMRRCVVVVIGMSRDAVQMGRVRGLPPLRQQPEVFEYVVLSVSSHPGAAIKGLAARTAQDAGSKRWREDSHVPYVVVDGLHHPGLGLADGHLEPLGLAIAGQRGRSVAYGTVRVHPDDRLPWLVIKVSGVHV